MGQHFKGEPSGIGCLVAKELLSETQALLEPFRLARYERRELHPTSNSPSPGAD